MKGWTHTGPSIGIPEWLKAGLMLQNSNRECPVKSSDIVGNFDNYI